VSSVFFINSTSQGFIHTNYAKKSFKTYRSFKNFSEENFVNDLMKSDLDNITEIEDVDEAYNKFEEVMVNTIDEHAPMKKKEINITASPFYE
jgi:hypothetical protein